MRKDVIEGDQPKKKNEEKRKKKKRKCRNSGKKRDQKISFKVTKLISSFINKTLM